VPRRTRKQQATDRFHLLQNVAAVLTQVFIIQTRYLAHVPPQRVAALTPIHDPTCPEATPQPSSVPLAPPPSSTAATRLARQRRTRRWTQYHEVWRYHRQGWTLDAIAQQVGLSRRTVQRYLQYPTFPERPPRYDRDRSILDPYKPLLLAGWNDGCRNGAHLFRLIQDQDFQGRYGMVALYVRRLRRASVSRPRPQRPDLPVPRVTAVQPRPLTPRCATWLVLRAPDQSAEEDQQLVGRLTRQSPALAEAVALAQDFASLVRRRQPEAIAGRIPSKRPATRFPGI
jgi:hypothetical protein